MISAATRPDPSSAVRTASKRQTGQNFGTFPRLLLILALAYYAIFFVISAICQHDSLWPVPAPHEIWGYVGSPVAPAVFLLLGAGVVALICGHLLGVASVRAVKIRTVPFQDFFSAQWLGIERGSAHIRFALCVLAITTVALFNLLHLRWPVLYQILNGAIFFCIALVRHEQIVRSESRPWHLAGHAALIFLFLAYASMQQWTGLFLAIVFIAVIEILYGRARWIAWGGMLLLAVLIYPAKRTTVPSHIAAICITAEEPPAGRYVAEIVSQCASMKDARALFSALLPWARDQILRRISTIRLLDRVWLETPEQVPYFRGETLAPLLYAVVPRFIWREKPREDIGNRIGHTYRVLNPADQVTSINLPWIVEFYINFGIVGVVAGLGIAGYMLGSLAWLGTSVIQSSILSLLTISILFPLAYQESNLSLMLGNTLHGFIGTLILIVLMRVVDRMMRMFRRTSPPV